MSAGCERCAQRAREEAAAESRAFYARQRRRSDVVFVLFNVAIVAAIFAVAVWS